MEPSTQIREGAFPAGLRQTSGPVMGITTEVVIQDFSDRILVTISQAGRLSQWVRPTLGLYRLTHP